MKMKDLFRIITLSSSISVNQTLMPAGRPKLFVLTFFGK